LDYNWPGIDPNQAASIRLAPHFTSQFPFRLIWFEAAVLVKSPLLYQMS